MWHTGGNSSVRSLWNFQTRRFHMQKIGHSLMALFFCHVSLSRHDKFWTQIFIPPFLKFANFLGKWHRTRRNFADFLELLPKKECHDWARTAEKGCVVQVGQLPWLLNWEFWIPNVSAWRLRSFNYWAQQAAFLLSCINIASEIFFTSTHTHTHRNTEETIWKIIEFYSERWLSCIIACAERFAGTVH